MKLERHVTSAIDDFGANKPDAALMHACFAIDGTAKKIFKKGGRAAYKNCLRQYYWIIEPMTGAGLNLEETKWSNIEIDDGNGKTIASPDLADIVYHIFRCKNAHGESVPANYTPIISGDGWSDWLMAKDQVSMPDKIIWALLAVAVFSKANHGTKTTGDYHLSWGSQMLGLGMEKFIIKDWWGREDDFRTFISARNTIRVKMENLEELRKNAPDFTVRG